MNKQDKILLDGVESIKKAFADDLSLKNIKKLNQTRKIYYRFQNKLNIKETNKTINIKHQYIQVSNNKKIRLDIYSPKKVINKIPCLLWIHGGGMVLGDAKYEKLRAINYVKKLNCTVVCVNYRLAPEFPYPCGLEDCYDSLEWITNNSVTLKINKERISVGGASAGGGLAAGLCLLNRDRKKFKIKFQLLIYPMINDKNVDYKNQSKPDAEIWTRKSNYYAWKFYLKNFENEKKIPIYAAPHRAKNLTKLPPAFIGVGSKDLFFEENLEYAKKLVKAGVKIELHTYANGYHGFDSSAPNAEISKRFKKDMFVILKKEI